MAGLGIALDFYEHNASARDGSGQTCAMLAKATDEQLRLLQVQRRLEQDTQGMPPPPGAPAHVDARWRFIDTPLNDTLYKCVCYGQQQAAERLRADFKVPEKRWWRLKTKGLAHSHAWGALWDFSNSKKPPTGLESFMTACLEQGAREEAARYAQRMPSAEAVSALLRLGSYDAARRVALQVKEKSPELLSSVIAHTKRGHAGEARGREA